VTDQTLTDEQLVVRAQELLAEGLTVQEVANALGVVKKRLERRFLTALGERVLATI
jgi:transcriptional regulator GlxA family with amidase domain